MENRFNNKDFEQFVKQSADQYRMFPSEKVWNSIHNTLHTRRRWYGIGLALLLLTTAAVTWIMLISPSGKQQQLVNTPIAATTKEFIEQKPETPEIIIAPVKPVRTKPLFVASPGNEQQNLFLADAGIPVSSSEDVYTNNDNELTEDMLPMPKAVTAAALSNNPSVTTKTVVAISKSSAPVNIPNKSAIAFAINKIPANNNNNSFPVSIMDSEEENNKKDEEKSTATPEDKALTVNKDIYPLTIESVTNSYTRITRAKKASWQIYFLPTVSYRKLSDNKNFLINSQASNAPTNFSIRDNINDVVTHKPDIGLEAGFNVGFPVAGNFKVTTGLQLNVSKYDIKAYPYQREDARIALSNALGSASVSTIESDYRAQESYTKPRWLSNFYISASLPIGAELKIARLKNETYLGVGGTIQPTYILGDRAYLISTDFKNYAKSTSLTRDWNVNTSFEVFAGYSTGKLDWKVGPQVRYQLLSSFAKKYPVKEHLMDFGLKVAVILNK